MARFLAAVGLALTTFLAAAGQRGVVSLAFLTATTVVAIAVVRAHRTTRRAAAALRFHGVVRSSLSPLARRGWHLKHGVRWPDRPGDGHLAMTPDGELAFAIRDCGVAVGDFDLAQAQDFATALSRTGRPYVPICAAATVVDDSTVERGVVCCTPRRLAAELLDAERAFAASLGDEATQWELLYGVGSGGGS